jgi:hypothetical protein
MCSLLCELVTSKGMVFQMVRGITDRWIRNVMDRQLVLMEGKAMETVIE